MAETAHATPTYGLIAAFETPEALVAAVDRTRQEGYRSFDAFSPFPIEQVSETVCDHQRSKVSLLVLIGGLTGAVAGFALQAWSAGIAYPLNIGGRPLLSWPAFIPVTFEVTVLFAALSAVFGMFMLNGLPKPYHPVFNVEGFERASVDRYFVLVEAEDPKFDPHATRAFLEGLGSYQVQDVDW